MFVKPSFSISNETIKNLPKKLQKDLFDQNENIRFSKLFNVGKDLIILGHPGSGKSFLVKYIVCSLVDSEDDEFEDKSISDALPFRIELRKYLAFKKENKGHIINYLSILLGLEYGIHNVPESSLSQTLKTQKTIIFFDGLDEIFNVSDRITVKNDIESFRNVFKDVRTVTTSRIIGYEDASLDPKLFIELKVNDFNDTQQKEYVTKWYYAEEEDKKIREKEIGDFLEKKNNVDKELLRNPLLLSLIVILYRNNLKLPESKLEVYQSCTSTLVDKWDVSKQLYIDMDEEIYRRKEAIFADLAYWQYTELSKNKGKITYERAKSIVGKIIFEKLELADEFNVDSKAENFMEYAKKRSIYFDNNFTHKTFLEYYTAFWVYANIEKKHKKNERDKLISKYISNPFWHIVLELLLNLIDKDQPDNEIIDDLINIQIKTKSSSKSIRFFLNVLPSLQNVSNRKIIELYLLSIDFLIEEAKSQEGRELDENMDADFLFEKESYAFTELQSHYFNDRLKPNLENALREYSGTVTAENKILFYRLYYEFMFSLRHRRRTGDKDKQFELIFSKEDTLPIITQNAELFRLSLFVEENDTMNGFLEQMRSLVELFGIEALFDGTSSIFHRFRILPFINIFIIRLINTEDINSYSRHLQSLSEIGVNYDDLFYKTATSDHPLVWHDEACKKIIGYLDLSLSEDIQKLIFVILNKFVHREFYPKSRIDFLELSSTITKEENKELLKKIVVTASDEVMGLNAILSYFNVKNKKIDIWKQNQKQRKKTR